MPCLILNPAMHAQVAWVAVKCATRSQRNHVGIGKLPYWGAMAQAAGLGSHTASSRVRKRTSLSSLTASLPTRALLDLGSGVGYLTLGATDLDLCHPWEPSSCISQDMAIEMAEIAARRPDPRRLAM